MSAVTPTPEWSRWTSQRQLPAWQCLALSVDVEPDHLGVDSFLVLRSALTNTPLGGESDPQWLITMCQRQAPFLEALAAKDNVLAVRVVKQPHQDTPVKLAEFVAWAVQHKWTLPKDLKAAFGVAEQSPRTRRSKSKKS